MRARCGKASCAALNLVADGGLGRGTGRLCDPDGAASGDGPGRLDLGVIRRIRPVNLEYAGTTAAGLFAPS